MRSRGYLANVDEEVREYFRVLEPEFPEWLEEYIETDALWRQKYISLTCGTIYSDLFESEFFYSSLDHSVAVALIVWHFTHDKKQTLAGLYHDISSPVFKHCVDVMEGDYEVQESTEELTTKIIAESADIKKLLERDGILTLEIDDYHLYPIADNDVPGLAADRLEYSFSQAMFTYRLIDLEKVKEFYNDISVQTNEAGKPELGFKTKKIARDFIRTTGDLFVIFRDDRTRYTMQFLADIMKRLSEEGKICKKDLYEMKESEVIKIIEGSKYADVFEIWRKAKRIKSSKEKPKGVYYVHCKSKVRYIDPLCQGQRMSKSCKIAQKMIDKNLAYDMGNYVWLEFGL